MVCSLKGAREQSPFPDFQWDSKLPGEKELRDADCSVNEKSWEQERCEIAQMLQIRANNYTSPVHQQAWSRKEALAAN